MRSPELIFQQILDRIISSRRVTPYDRTTLLAIARSEFVPAPTELERIEKIFKHLNLGLIKVID